MIKTKVLPIITIITLWNNMNATNDSFSSTSSSELSGDLNCSKAAFKFLSKDYGDDDLLTVAIDEEAFEKCLNSLPHNVERRAEIEEFKKSSGVMPRRRYSILNFTEGAAEKAVYESQKEGMKNNRMDYILETKNMYEQNGLIVDSRIENRIYAK